MEGPLLKGLYWEYAYNAGNPRTICPGGEEARALGPCPLAPSDRNILYENRLLGLPRYGNVSDVIHYLYLISKVQCSY